MSLTGIINVLVVIEDKDVETQIIRVLQETLKIDNIVSVGSVGKATSELLKQVFQVAIIDQKLRGRAGLNLIQTIRGSDKTQLSCMPILCMVGTIAEEEQALIREVESLSLLRRPFLDSALAEKVMRLLNQGDVMSAHSNADFMDHDQFVRVVNAAILSRRLGVAEEAIERGLQKDPRSPRVLILKASLLFAKGDTAGALLVTQKVLTGAPDYVPALNMKAKIAVREERYEEALRVMEVAKKLSPLNVRREMEMGEINLGHGRYNSARDKFERALKLYPEFEAAKAGLARVYAEQGQSDRANEFVAQLSDPNSIVSELNLKGVLLAKNLRFKDAIDLYQKAMAVSHNNQLSALLCYNIALAYFKIQDSKNALENIEKGIKYDPDFVKATRLKSRINAGKFFDNDRLLSVPCLLTSKQLEFIMGRPSSPDEDEATGAEADVSGNKYTQLYYGDYKSSSPQADVAKKGHKKKAIIDDVVNEINDNEWEELQGSDSIVGGASLLINGEFVKPAGVEPLNPVKTPEKEEIDDIEEESFFR